MREIEAKHQEVPSAAIAPSVFSSIVAGQPVEASQLIAKPQPA